jgi:D-3-phosphoglycerate dehydrogenase
LKVAALNCEWSVGAIEAHALAEHDVTFVEGACHRHEDTVALAADADGLLATLSRLPRAVLEQLPRCRVVSVLGVGTDDVDAEAAAELGMYVTHVPDYGTEEVALHTVALALTILRRIPFQDALVRRGHWDAHAEGPVPRLSEAAWGVVGFGRIGRAVAARARALGARVLAHDPYAEDAMSEAGVEPAEIDDLLREADVVTLNAPLTPETESLLNARRLALMKPASVLVNAGRGALVDEPALLDALSSGHLAGAALDVLRDEPAPPGHPLLRHPRTIVTPHMAHYSEQALVELRRRGAEAVADVFAGREPRNVVAAPATNQPSGRRER